MNRMLLAALALVLALPLAADADVEHGFKSSVPVGSIQRVVIDVPYGSFTVRNGTANRLSLAGIASRDYDTAKEKAWAQKVVDDTSVEFVVNGAEAVVRRKFGRNADSWRAQRFTGFDIRLDLPPGIDVEFQTSAGEVNLAGDFGDIGIEMSAGEIQARLPRAKVRELNATCRVGEVRTHIGNEVVTKEGVLPGKTNYFNPDGKTHVNIHVTAGEIDVTLE